MYILNRAVEIYIDLITRVLLEQSHAAFIVIETKQDI